MFEYHGKNIPSDLDTAILTKNQIRYTGFIAQEVEQAANNVGFDFSGVDKPQSDSDYYGLRYAEFTVPLVKATQELSKKVETLEDQNKTIANQIANQKELLFKYETTIEDALKRLEAIENNLSNH